VSIQGPSLELALGEKRAQALRNAVVGARALADETPASSAYWLTNARRHIIPQGTKEDFVAATRLLSLWDLHSALSAQRLMYRWRAAQFGEMVLVAFDAWHLGVAATLARSLLEMAAAYTVEAEDVIQAWNEMRPDTTARAQALRKRLIRQVVQMTLATRSREVLNKLGHTNEHPSRVARTKVGRLIEKAGKRLNDKRLGDLYGELSEAVHPNFGATEYYYVEAGFSTELEQLRVLLNRHAVGRSDLSPRVAEAAIWGLSQMLEMDARFGATLTDMVVDLEFDKRLDPAADYWGRTGDIVSPGGSSADSGGPRDA
jgi:hypothetical protein